MSILIKGMEMSDKVTTIVIFPEGKARVFRQDIDHDEWLTVIEVPAPHGRLIDADELEEKCHGQALDEWNKATGTTWGYAYATFESDVEDAPTIIEAEIITLEERNA